MRTFLNKVGTGLLLSAMAMALGGAIYVMIYAITQMTSLPSEPQDLTYTCDTEGNLIGFKDSKYDPELVKKSALCEEKK